MGIGAIDLIITIVVLVGLFILFRAILLWYWRANEGIDLLKSIKEQPPCH